MQAYIDQIKECAAGSILDDEELVFHALNGLPSAFNSFKTPLRARAEPIKFDELISLPNAEDMHVTKDQASDVTTVENSSAFVAVRFQNSNAFVAAQSQRTQAPFNQSFKWENHLILVEMIENFLRNLLKEDLMDQSH